MGEARQCAYQLLIVSTPKKFLFIEMKKLAMLFYLENQKIGMFFFAAIKNTEVPVDFLDENERNQAKSKRDPFAGWEE